MEKHDVIKKNGDAASTFFLVRKISELVGNHDPPLHFVADGGGIAFHMPMLVGGMEICDAQQLRRAGEQT